MMSYSLMMLLIGHLIGDFILQSPCLVEKKEKSIGYLFLHCGLYLIPVFCVLLCFCDWLQVIIFSLIVVVSHFMFDFSKIKLNKGRGKVFDFFGFVLDQILHVVILISLSCFMLKFNAVGEFLVKNPFTTQKLISCELEKAMMCLLVILSMVTFFGVFIKKLLSLIFKDQKSEDDAVSNNSAGYVIGCLERVIIIVFGLMGLYECIGLVLTAKSIARVPECSKGGFAEKYLVGTLVSLLIAIVGILVIQA